MGLKSAWIFSIASTRKRSTSSLALVRAIRSLDRYVTPMMVKKTGTVRMMNDVRMLGLRRKFRKMVINQPSEPAVSAAFQGDELWYPTDLSASMKQSVERRAPQMPAGRLLKSVASRHDPGLVEGSADD